MIGILLSLVQVSAPPPPLPYPSKSFGGLSVSCSILRQNGTKDEFTGHLGAQPGPKGQPPSPKVKFVVDTDTTQHLSQAEDAIGVDGYTYVSFVGWPADMRRLVFKFGAFNASGAASGTVTISSFTFATLNSTEQWQCTAQRQADSVQ